MQPGFRTRRHADRRGSASEAHLFSTGLLAQARIHVGRVGFTPKVKWPVGTICLFKVSDWQGFGIRIGRNDLTSDSGSEALQNRQFSDVGRSSCNNNRTLVGLHA